MASLDADGAAAFDLALPPDLPSGRWTALIGLPGSGKGEITVFGSMSFSVEDFMPDRIKVDLALNQTQAADDDDDKDEAEEPANPSSGLPRLAVGDEAIEAAVQADYLFGQPAANLQASLNARLDPVPFSHENWSAWIFGDTAGLIELPGDSPTGAILPHVRNQRSKSKTHDGKDNGDITLDEKGHGAVGTRCEGHAGNRR